MAGLPGGVPGARLPHGLAVQGTRDGLRDRRWRLPLDRLRVPGLQLFLRGRCPQGSGGSAIPRRGRHAHQLSAQPARQGDELASFLGASYFRALGRDNIYGLSARGLLINSWRDGPEEFPRFSEFYLEKPTDKGPLTLYAALESPSVTGAYRIVIDPASDARQETVMEVTARLYFRADIAELGIAPLTSMFLFAETNRHEFDDYRPQVHDSNGCCSSPRAGKSSGVRSTTRRRSAIPISGTPISRPSGSTSAAAISRPTRTPARITSAARRCGSKRWATGAKAACG